MVQAMKRIVVWPEAAYDPRHMDEVVICLEMTAPSQLVPARRPPTPLEIEEVGPAEAPVLRSIYARIWDALASGGRTEWSDAQWTDELSRPGVRAWVARADDELAGCVELEAEPNRDVGIVVFGLVPELIGKGFGGAFLDMGDGDRLEAAVARRRLNEAGLGTDLVR
jgi:hypothetical protein